MRRRRRAGDGAAPPEMGTFGGNGDGGIGDSSGKKRGKRRSHVEDRRFSVVYPLYSFFILVPLLINILLFFGN